MNRQNSIFSFEAMPEARILQNLEQVADKAAALSALGIKKVLTSGSYDNKHVGHDRYLGIARAKGEILFVGVDSDDKIRIRKGRNPIVPEAERVESLCHTRYADFVYVKQVSDEKHAFIKAVRPDVLIISESTNGRKHSVEELNEYRAYASEVIELPRQLETSTSARLRMFQLEIVDKVETHLAPQLVELIQNFVGGLRNGDNEKKGVR